MPEARSAPAAHAGRRAHAMEVVSGLEALTPDHGRLFVVVGVFDGLHLGHLYLIRHLRREARRHAARPAVITFDAHPDEVLVGSAPPLLCDPDERLVRLEQAGVEVTIVWPFDAAVRMTPYDRWIDSIRERVDLAGFLMTPDAAFGFERRGSPAAVAAYGRQVDPPYEVVVVPPLELGGRPVRSAEIRSDVAAGDLRAARALLGRSVSVAGEAARVGTAVQVSFPLPVALPPPARYSAIVEPAWVEPELGHAGEDEAGGRAASGSEAGDGQDGAGHGQSRPSDADGSDAGDRLSRASDADTINGGGVGAIRGGMRGVPRASRRMVAEVEPTGRVVLHGDGVPQARRLRVTFVSALR